MTIPNTVPLDVPTPDVATPTTPAPKPSALDKYNAVAGALSDSVQKGLSYANARRAREEYRPQS